MAQLIFQRGDIHWVEFPKKEGDEKVHTIQEAHPAVIISNNKQNQFSSVVTVLPITSRLDKTYPFELLVNLDKPKLLLLTKYMLKRKLFLWLKRR